MMIACCTAFFTGTKRMLGRVTASKSLRIIALVLLALAVRPHETRHQDANAMATTFKLASPFVRAAKGSRSSTVATPR